MNIINKKYIYGLEKPLKTRSLGLAPLADMKYSTYLICFVAQIIKSSRNSRSYLHSNKIDYETDDSQKTQAAIFSNNNKQISFLNMFVPFEYQIIIMQIHRISSECK